jgi:ribonucleoside-diphosphate reductase alpha chain
MLVTKRDGTTEPLDIAKIHKVTEWACSGLDASQSTLEVEAKLQFFNGIRTSQIHDALIGAAAGLNSVEYQDYTFVAARLVLQKVYKEAVNDIHYPHLAGYIERGIEAKKLDPRLGTAFDLAALNAAIVPERDMQFTFVGIQTLADRYLLRGVDRKLIELPQHFYMRVAMGLSLLEADPTSAAIEFYNVLSNREFHNSTPTLFNAGTTHPQLASCFLNTVADRISNEEGTHKHASIFGTIEECANLSKFAGGLGTDWTRVREKGSWIKGTDGVSSGPVPYLKIYNDTAVAVNQGGKRQGSFAPYMETHHPDLYDFLDLKKESGDERQRAHDIYPANWIPDLFMQRVKDGGMWSFFSVAQYPELHELVGPAYVQRYTELEREGKFTRQLPAMDVWKRMLGALFETGHPWITFKDTINLRNPQDHVGVIHSSNLCTEITLNTSDDETAVCNIGSTNLAAHVKRNADGTYSMDWKKLQRTIRTAIRMLDNTLDIGIYVSERAKLSNFRHRPIGLGVMGYTELLVMLGIDWESQEHLEFADRLMERFSYYAIDASADLAKERGAYATFKGSKWSRGILPIDTAKYEAAALTKYEHEMSWDILRGKIQAYGMRNSNVMAIAPTATISNIVGTTATIEPVYERTTTKKNQSGVFIVTDPSLRYGRPELCKEAHEIDQTWLIKSAAVRQKWIDQAQSLNLFAARGTKGRDLHAWYMLAWELGLKTTYYLKGQSAQIETKPTMTVDTAIQIAAEAQAQELDALPNGLCSIDNPDCESCQ